MSSALPRLLALFGFLCLANVARAENHTAPIRDDAGLFHADTITHAEQRIEDIRRTFHRNVFVRTIASISPHQPRMLAFLSKTEANRLMKERVRTFADESGLPGIYVVICRKPRNVHALVRPSNDPEFTPHDAEALRHTLARRLQDRGSDQALLGLVEQVRAVLQGHVTRGESQSAANDFVLAGLLGGGLFLWLLLTIVRFQLRAARSRASKEETVAMQAHRTPALLAAMFGFPAGLWISDKLYPCLAGTSLPLCEPEAKSKLVSAEERMEATDVEEHSQEDHPQDAPVSPG